MEIVKVTENKRNKYYKLKESKLFMCRFCLRFNRRGSKERVPISSKMPFSIEMLQSSKMTDLMETLIVRGTF